MTRTSAGTWGELLKAGRLPLCILVCLAVWLNAVDTLVASTIMPTVARDVGGYAFFSWATAGYMLGSILAGAGAGLLVLRIGLRGGFALASLLYGAGCIASGAAPTIAPFLLGRLAQGAGAGLLVGLCYVAVQAHLPERLWTTGFAVLAAVWGVATLLGPLVGGVFAAMHAWRALFFAFAVQAAVVALLGWTLLPAHDNQGVRAQGLPVRQLLALSLAVGLIAGAGVTVRPVLAIALAALALAMLGLTVRLDRHAAVRLLPAAVADVASAPAMGYAAGFLLSTAAIGFSVYGSALVQARLGLGPLAAGYIVASEAVGWTVAALAIARAPVAWRSWLIRGGALAIAAGLAASAATLSRAGAWAITGSGLLIGGGFGMCWSFISQRILNALPPAEATLGAAAVPMIQLLGDALGAAGSGALANALGLKGGFTAAAAAHAAPLLFGAFTPVALLGAAAAWRLTLSPALTTASASRDDTQPATL